MALTLRHWIGIGAFGCAVIGISYLPPSPDRYETRQFGFGAWDNPRALRAGGLRRSINETEQTLQALSLRDSLLRLFPANVVREDGPAGLVDRAFAPSVRRKLEGTLAFEWTELQPVRGTIAAGVAIVPDTGLYLTRRPVYVLPAATGGGRCLAVHPFRIGRPERFDATWASYYIQRTSNWTGLLGPCGFYAAFGPPGREIEAWLIRHRFRFAGVSNWRHVSLIRDVTPWGRDCGRGNLEACRAYLDERAAPGTVAEPADRRFGLSEGLLITYWWYPADARDHLLASLRADMGPEPFAKFWQSPLAPDSAFKVAFGVPMEEWASRWMARSALKRDSAYWGDSRSLGYGKRLRPGLLAVNLLIVVLLVACGAFFSERRQV